MCGVDDQPAAQPEEMRRLRLLLDRLPALIGYWDRELRNVVANQSYVDYFGMTPDEIRGRQIREVLGEEVYALNLPYIRGALAGREQLFERTLIDQQGATRYTQASYLPDIVDGAVRGFYVQVTDVTARVEAERARDEAVRMYEISMANSPFGNGVFDTSAHALQVNPALCELLACTAADLIDKDFRRFIHPDSLMDAEMDLVALVRDSSQISSEHRYVRLDGTTIWMQHNAVLVPGAHGADDVIVAQFQDVTARREAETELARMAVTDSLTGLNNRHALEECVQRHGDVRLGASVGIIFVDLDGFKDVNDAHGHVAGDAVLIEAAARLTAVAPEPNSVFRLGGDEFVVVVPSAESAGSVAELAGLIGQVMDGRYEIAPTPVTVAASVGCAYGPADDVEALMRIADSNMYEHKARRRRTRVVSTDS